MPCTTKGREKLRVVMHDDLCIRSSTHLKVLLDQPGRSKQSLRLKAGALSTGDDLELEMGTSSASRVATRSMMTVVMITLDHNFASFSCNSDKPCLEQSFPPPFSLRTLANSPLNASG